MYNIYIYKQEKATEGNKIYLFVQMWMWKELVRVKLSWGKVHMKGLKKAKQYSMLKLRGRGRMKVNA